MIRTRLVPAHGSIHYTVSLTAVPGCGVELFLHAAFRWAKSGRHLVPSSLLYGHGRNVMTGWISAYRTHSPNRRPRCLAVAAAQHCSRLPRFQPSRPPPRQCTQSTGCWLWCVQKLVMEPRNSSCSLLRLRRAITMAIAPSWSAVRQRTLPMESELASDCT
jgi:hypothetical protein